jgi:opacity protein-like surface antigen
VKIKISKMKTKLFLLGLLVSTMTMVGQTTGTADSKPETWYFKLGGSYFVQTAATEFPIVSGALPNTDVYAANGTTLVSREANTGSFGEGFRTGLNVGYRFSPRLGVEMGFNYFTGNSKTMVQTTNKYVPNQNNIPIFASGKAEGKITAFDLAPAIVLFLGEVKGFEPYTKVGVIVPVVGDLTIETNRTYTTPAGTVNSYTKDVVLPNPTVGFMAALGTSYKLGKNISAFAELEYRNFTVHGKTKETKEYTENGVDKLNTPATFRPDASYSANHVNYVDQINSNSNNPLFNPNTATLDPSDTMRPNDAKDDISSYVGISGLGLTLGLKYSL